MDGRLVAVGIVEYGIRDGLCGGMDGSLVVVGNVEYVIRVGKVEYHCMGKVMGLCGLCGGMDGRLVVVGNVEYGIRDGACGVSMYGQSDGICGGMDGRLVAVVNVDYGIKGGTCDGVDGRLVGDTDILTTVKGQSVHQEEICSGFKPGKKTKKFIDKKNAVSFHLVHRSQRDPLQADSEASQHVLLQVPDSEKNDLRKQELLKYGIEYEDDYDYMQHLRDADELNEVGPTEVYRVTAKETKKNQEPQITLPASVFGTEYETSVGLLNKAVPLRGPQVDWDPDIVAGLDEDFDYDNPSNQLDDDFILKANAEGYSDNPSENSEKQVIGSDNEYEDYPSDEAEDSAGDNVSDVGSLGEQSFMSAETKTRFTDYSMSSSIMKRNDGLTLLDDRFERLYEAYDDDEIGALDQEEIGGFINENSAVLNSVLDEFEEKRKQIKLKDVVQKGDHQVDMVSDTESSSAEDELIEVEQPKEQFDCESILSTYSTLYNHPTVISEKSKKPIKLTKRTAIPSDVLPDKGLTSKQQERELHLAEKGDRANTYRPKNESPEEKKQRKQAVKDERKNRREEKKLNQLAFKTEEMKQNREVMNVRKDLQGIKIV